MILKLLFRIGYYGLSKTRRFVHLGVDTRPQVVIAAAGNRIVVELFVAALLSVAGHKVARNSGIATRIAVVDRELGYSSLVLEWVCLTGDKEDSGFEVVEL